MFYLRLADLTVCVENQYHYIEEMCREYITSDAEADFTVAVTEREIAEEDNGTGFDRGYLESLAVYRKIAERITAYGGVLMHGVVIETKGEGIAFLAKSGVGKTTHTRLWSELLGNAMTVVNGDKPLLRLVGETLFAYGTPWAGKENIHKNTKVLLTKICFLERSETNECVPLDKKLAFERLFPQIYRPIGTENLLGTLDILNAVIEKTDFYVIRCNMELSAAKTAYEGLMQ